MKQFLRLSLMNFFLTGLLFAPYNHVHAQAAIELSTPVISGLTQPMQFVSANDGTNRYFIVQKEGAVLVYDAGFNALGNFLTLTGLSTSGEQGLLSMVFHPDYETNGLFYVYYNNAAGDLELSRYTVSTTNANVADPASAVLVLTVPHPVNSNHNGSEMHFGNDGYLYISTGDGGGGGDMPNNAQTDASLLGKMLRLNVNTSATPPFYTIPPGNPLGTLMYNKGLRNPYRWSFDRLTNDMWIGDVGQNNWEEIDFRAASSINNTNWGWRCYEGDSAYNVAGCGPISNYTFPVFAYSDGQSITGGNVYRGVLHPSLYGQYIAADHYSGNFYNIIPDGIGGFNTIVQPALQTSIVDFGEDENGELFAISLAAGAVYRIAAQAIVPVNLISFQAMAWNQAVRLHWTTAQETNLTNFVVEYSTDGHNFNPIGSVNAENDAQTNQYSIVHTQMAIGHAFYRLRINNVNGTVQYSAVKHLNFSGTVKNFIQTTIITDGIIRLILPEGYQKLKVLNSAGALVSAKNIEGLSGNLQIQIPGNARGIYMLVLYGKNGSVTQKLMVQ